MVPFLARPVFDVIPRRGPFGVCCVFGFGFKFNFVVHVAFLPQDHLPDNLVQEALDRDMVSGVLQGKFKDEVLRIGIGGGGLGFVLLNVLVPPVTNLVEPFRICSRKDVVVDRSNRKLRWRRKSFLGRNRCRHNCMYTLVVFARGIVVPSALEEIKIEWAEGQRESHCESNETFRGIPVSVAVAELVFLFRGLFHSGRTERTTGMGEE